MREGPEKMRLQTVQAGKAVFQDCQRPTTATAQMDGGLLQLRHGRGMRIRNASSLG